MKIITETLTTDELKRIALNGFGDFVKAVVDIDKGRLALDAELHSDLEALLLENGSRQESLWGVNLYPDISGDGFVEFDSMINIRPSHGNRSRGVDSEAARKQIIELITKKLKS